MFVSIGSAFATGLFFSTFSVPIPMGQAVVDEGAFRPVFYGGHASTQACARKGLVDGLAARRGELVAVRKGPGREFKPVNSLLNGDIVWICDAKSEWVGVVFKPKDDPTAECGTTQQEDRRLPYAGPCRSGWVHRQWIRSVG